MATRADRIRDLSRARRDREREAVRAHLLDTARQLFEQRGYAEFSLREVAERAGYAPTTIYRYFQDKDDLLFALTDEGFGAFGVQMQAAYDSTDDPQARLMALGHAYIRFGLANPLYYRLMFMERPDFLIRMPAKTECAGPPIDSLLLLHRAVEAALHAGVLHPAPAETLADTLWSATHGVVALAISMPIYDAPRIERLTAMMMEVSMAGMSLEPPPTG